ncbi:MAG: GFA family protein [Sedimentisphaerales bacterium]|nr:GFA family protein [Sedimentisphaerales bacterium]MBN2841752.1 GFA family protein [Sedimentisphaerales bacterium]
MEYNGSCLCKEVEYKIVGTFDSFYLCHCKLCRKDTGSAHAANLFSSTAKLEWIKGQENVRRFHLKKFNHVKAFCAICGSALPSMQMDDTLLVVPAGSLDCNLDVAPNAHIFISNKANWDDKLETIKSFQHLPDEQ